MKKLFADPRYNVMDGLDVYIDDYSKPDPIPYAMLRGLASAKFLGLFDAEEKEEAAAREAAAAAAQPRDVADNPTAQTVAQSGEAPPALPSRLHMPPDFDAQAQPCREDLGRHWGGAILITPVPTRGRRISRRQGSDEGSWPAPGKSGRSPRSANTEGAIATSGS